MSSFPVAYHPEWKKVHFSKTARCEIHRIFILNFSSDHLMSRKSERLHWGVAHALADAKRRAVNPGDASLDRRQTVGQV